MRKTNIAGRNKANICYACKGRFLQHVFFESPIEKKKSPISESYKYKIHKTNVRT